jgi:hypothetical protein
MFFSRHWRAALLGVAAVAVGCIACAQEAPVSPRPLSVLGGAGQPGTLQPAIPGAPDAGGGGFVAPAKVLKTRVFRLKACDPDDVRQILEGLLEEPAEMGAAGGPVFGGGGGLVGAAPGFGAPGAGAVGGPGFGGFGGGAGIGGGFAGLAGATQTWRVATHANTRALVVRGSERDLQIASDLVTVLETPDDKPLPEVKSLRAFRLKHADADELVSVVQELEIQARIVAAPLARLLIARGAAETLGEVAELVKELDVEVKKDGKPAEPKMLLPKGGGGE